VPTGGGQQGQSLLTSIKGQTLSIIQRGVNQGSSPFNYSTRCQSRVKPFQLFNEVSIQGSTPFNHSTRCQFQGTSPFNYSTEVPTGRGQCGHPAHLISRDKPFQLFNESANWQGPMRSPCSLPFKGQRFIRNPVEHSPNSPTQEYQHNGQSTIRGHSLGINVETIMCLLHPINQRRLYKKVQLNRLTKSHSCLQAHYQLQTTCQRRQQPWAHTN
jgi:hypothetical protein